MYFLCVWIYRISYQAYCFPSSVLISSCIKPLLNVAKGTQHTSWKLWNSYWCCFLSSSHFLTVGWEYDVSRLSLKEAQRHRTYCCTALITLSEMQRVYPGKCNRWLEDVKTECVIATARDTVYDILWETLCPWHMNYKACFSFFISLRNQFK